MAVLLQQPSDPEFQNIQHTFDYFVAFLQVAQPCSGLRLDLLATEHGSVPQQGSGRTGGGAALAQFAARCRLGHVADAQQSSGSTGG